MSAHDSDVAAWSARDHRHAVLPVDHEIIEATSALRALILELIRAPAPHRDLFSACAVLGRMIAERGGSPTLASSTMDGAHETVEQWSTPRHDWLRAARSALAEGFAAARLDMARREAVSAWEYPKCAVVLGADVVAIVPGFPADDGEALAAWASRVAHGASLAGVRRAIVGSAPPPAARDSAREALVEALQTAGIDVQSSQPPPPSRASWLPWRRPRDRAR